MNNPQAYPAKSYNTSKGEPLWEHKGMTLLDYFAAKAMQGSIGSCATLGSLAERAYEIAEAMLIERAKRMK